MIVKEILDFWIETFTARMAENDDDALKIKTVQLMPFQDDPDRKGPYLLIGEDFDKGIVPEGPAEIGGSTWWMAHFKIRAAPKSVTSADRAYYLASLLGQRIVYTLRKNTFAMPEGQGVASMYNLDWFVVTKVAHKVYGGEREWRAYIEVDFKNRIREPGPYPYGNYPGDIE